MNFAQVWHRVQSMCYGSCCRMDLSSSILSWRLDNLFTLLDDQCVHGAMETFLLSQTFCLSTKLITILFAIVHRFLIISCVYMSTFCMQMQIPYLNYYIDMLTVFLVFLLQRRLSTNVNYNNFNVFTVFLRCGSLLFR